MDQNLSCHLDSGVWLGLVSVGPGSLASVGVPGRLHSSPSAFPVSVGLNSVLAVPGFNPLRIGPVSSYTGSVPPAEAHFTVGGRISIAVTTCYFAWEVPVVVTVNKTACPRQANCFV